MPTLNTCDIELACSSEMDEAAETGPMKMDGGKTREVELLFSRLPIFRKLQGRSLY